MYWLWYILIGLVAGWLAGLIVKGSGSGLLLNIVIGIVGSVIGGWLFGLMGLSSNGGTWGSLITALVGAIVLLLIVSLFTRRRA